MNTLAYVLMSILLTNPRSGYELKQLINIFWEAHHSQIYTTLAKLTQDDFLVADQAVHSQKKIYQLTDQGQAAVHEWIKTETPAPIQKDEFLAKIYVLATLDRNTANGLLFTRQQQLEKTLQLNQTRLAEIDKKNPADLGRYVVIQRRISLCQEELNWCAWVQELLEDYFK